MSTSTPSQLELDAIQTRNDARQQTAKNRELDAVRGPVEGALSLHKEAGRIQKLNGDHDADVNGFQTRAERDRLDWRLRWVFGGTLAAYVIIEWMSSGDVSAMIANSMAPHFGLDSVTGEAPLWLRRAAGGAFVGAMLAVTLLIKLITGLGIKRLKAMRAGLMPGEENRHRNLTWGIGGFYGVKVAYIGAVAGLYVWLWGFALQRSIIMAELSSAQTQTSEMMSSNFSLKDGALQQDMGAEAGKAAEAKADAMAAGHRLAGATGVFYSLIVFLHLGVLFLPISDLSRPLELHKYHRSRADDLFTSVTGRRDQTLREIYERVRTAPLHYRTDLVEATEPVHALINQLYRRHVIGIVGATTAKPSAAAWSDDIHSEMPTEPSPFAAPDQPEPASDPSANWDDIFPNKAA